MVTKLVFLVDGIPSPAIDCEISNFPKQAQKGDHFRAKFLGPKAVAVIDRREWIPHDYGGKSVQEETLCIYCIVDYEVFNKLLSMAKLTSVASVIRYEIPAQNWRD